MHSGLQLLFGSNKFFGGYGQAYVLVKQFLVIWQQGGLFYLTKIKFHLPPWDISVARNLPCCIIIFYLNHIKESEPPRSFRAKKAEI